MTTAKGTGYVRGNRQFAGKKLASHFKYLEHRPKGPEETREDRAIFSKDDDQVIRRDAIDEVMSHTSTSANFHKVVLSPSEEEPIADWKEWTRNVMRDLEDYKGQNLHWFAVKHNNTDNPHVHVVIAGSGENLDTGRPKAVKLYTKEYSPNGRDDYEFLRNRGREHSGYEDLQRNRAIAQDINQEMNGIDRADRFASQPARAPHDHSRTSKGIDR